MKSRIRLAHFLVFSLLALSSSCSKQPQSGSAQEAQKPFRFDYSQITELSIAKQDLEHAVSWFARLKRVQADPPQWKIEASSQTLIDAYADGPFLQHLLDTLTVYRAEGPAPQGPLASLGLDPAQWVLQWSAPQKPPFELRIGEIFERPQQRAYSLVSPSTGPTSQPVIGRGSTLQLLGYLKNFEALRLKRLTLWTSDDPDRFEILRNGKKVLFAERHTGDWVDANQKQLRIISPKVNGEPLYPDAGAVLEALTHLQIQVFYDDPEETAKLFEKFKASRKEKYQAILTNRRDQKVTLTLLPGEKSAGASERENSVLATSSDRPHAIFRLHEGAIKPFLITSASSGKSSNPALSGTQLRAQDRR